MFYLIDDSFHAVILEVVALTELIHLILLELALNLLIDLVNDHYIFPMFEFQNA